MNKREAYVKRILGLHGTKKMKATMGKILVDPKNEDMVVVFYWSNKLVHHSMSDDFILLLRETLSRVEEEEFAPYAQVMEARLQMVAASRKLREAKEDVEIHEKMWEKREIREAEEAEEKEST